MNNTQFTMDMSLLHVFCIRNKIYCIEMCMYYIQYMYTLQIHMSTSG